MSGRTLAILASTFAAAVAFVFWLEPGKPKEGEGGTPPGPLATFDPAAVRRVEIAAADGSSFAVVRDPVAGYRLEAGAGLEADASRVEGLLSALTEARVERTLDAASTPDPAACGLAPAERTVRLAGESATLTFEFGRASPVGYRRYARVNGGPIVLVDGAIGTAVDRGEGDFVERRLLPMEATRVRRIEIDGPPGRIVLERTASEWRIVEPFDDRADLGAAENLARSMTAMTVEGLEPGAADFAAGTRVRVDAEAGGPSREARVAPGPGRDRREVERRPGPVRGRILEAAARDLERDPEAMRDTRVCVFSTPDVRAIAWRAGSASVSARRDGGGGPWAREDADGSRRPVDSAAVEGLLDATRWLRAAGFAPPPAGSPLATLELSGDAGRFDLLEFVEEAPAGPVLVRSSARPGIAARIARAGYEELAVKAGALAR